MVFQVKYLALFLFLSVIDGFGLFWMGRLHKNIQVKMEFLKGSFLVLHFSYYTWMAFLMMLFVILLSILMMLLSALYVNTAISSDDTILSMLMWSGIWSVLWQQLELRLLNLNLICETLDWDTKKLVDFSAEKTQTHFVSPV